MCCHSVPSHNLASQSFILSLLQMLDSNGSASNDRTVLYSDGALGQSLK